MEKTIYLFRHADVDERYRQCIRGGGTDCGLSEGGILQSLNNASWLIRKRVALIVTTGLSRTNFLGTLMKREYGVQHHVDPRLRERDMGAWEGRSYACMHAELPDHGDRFAHDPLDIAVPGIEPADAFRQRVQEGWEDIMQTTTDRIAVVAHGIVNHVILQYVMQDMQNRLLHPGHMTELDLSATTPRIVRHNVCVANPAHSMVEDGRE